MVSVSPQCRWTLAEVIIGNCARYAATNTGSWSCLNFRLLLAVIISPAANDRRSSSSSIRQKHLVWLVLTCMCYVGSTQLSAVSLLSFIICLFLFLVLRLLFSHLTTDAKRQLNRIAYVTSNSLHYRIAFKSSCSRDCLYKLESTQFRIWISPKI